MGNNKDLDFSFWLEILRDLQNVDARKGIKEGNALEIPDMHWIYAFQLTVPFSYAMEIFLKTFQKKEIENKILIQMHDSIVKILKERKNEIKEDGVFSFHTTLLRFVGLFYEVFILNHGNLFKEIIINKT